MLIGEGKMKCINRVKEQASMLASNVSFAILYGATLSCLCVSNVFAQGTGSAPEGSIGSVAENVQGSFSALAMVITSGSYIAGFAMVLAAIFKFKAHKDNPTQIPVGTPIALLFIGASLIFLPQIFSISGTTLFGSEGETGGVEGVTEFGSFSSGS
jgi:intracellular multiplication protein IcmD